MAKQLVAFPYYGGKYYHAKWIISLLPDHHHYVEPFCGAAHILLNKSPSKIETINDLNENVINFFRVLREQPDELKRLLELTPYARREYEKSYEPTDNPLESARRFYVMMRMGFSAQPARAKGSSWSYTVNTSQPKGVNAVNAAIAGLDKIVERIKLTQLECRPAIDIIKRFDRPDTLFYCDPPYTHCSREKNSSGMTGYGKFEMQDIDHEQLADVLHACKGKVAISGYHSDLYDSMYSDWQLHEKETVAHGAGTEEGKIKPKRIECLWVNYEQK